MNKYESVIIINQNLKKQEVENIITQITELINKNGKVTKIDKNNMKILQYQINSNAKGYYITLYFETTPNFIIELHKNYTTNKNIIKTATIQFN